MIIHPVPGVAVMFAVALVFVSGCLDDGPAEVVRTIAPLEASALIEEKQGDPGFVIIDLRRADELASGQVPGAININSAHFGEHLDTLDREGTYLIYCQRGGRSPGIREMMREAGFNEVYEIEGGLSAW
ncbi:MAG: rhodanese-like domain-containing protein, partial [Methanomicrobiales archaeon]|nr:rhodanese-like domain-containing protein [Methanomicrobiales archaeon]